MPVCTFVVIAYNVERYIGRCLQSLKAQTVQDFEVVVVNDASTDGTVKAIQQEIDGDERFRFINKASNAGAHLARRTGAAASQGKYVIFVDGDDSITRNCLELLQPVLENSDYDILRFGRDVMPASSTESDVAFAYENEEMFNQGDAVLSGHEILESIYSERTHRNTWSIIDCAFNGDFVRDVFAEMTDYPLGRMQDSYEMFVLCSKARTMRMLPDVRGLRYYLGAGISGRSRETLNKFDYLQESARKDYEHVNAFARLCDEAAISECATWLGREYLRIIGNEWVTRLSPDDQATAIEHLLLSWRAKEVSDIMSDPLMARGRWLLEQDMIPAKNDEFYRWGAVFEQSVVPKLSEEQSSSYDAYYQLKHDVEQHVANIVRRREEEARKRQLEAIKREQERGFIHRALNKVAPDGSLCRDMIRVVRAHSRRGK
ncbi:glycosyltransferase family 2 protein [Bifidobacterium sp. LC6]|uniref:Glycosyltransferase family 2 protein n=1 Tax=Bifidobacterium colobi TaxID=2809026 RepID=A0ABS5UWZ5_9BIFI|nr:glycosyltransferase family 2 protein [Bifidobacterium colobi]MBT1175653.1 glycosyltransferase family 2 protein [Bifidobacterium colobi]